MAEDTPASSSPTTLAPTVLTSSSVGLSRLSQENITQIATVVAGLIRPPPLPGTESSSSSSANPLQVSGSLSSSEASSSGLVPTPPSSTTLQSRPGVAATRWSNLGLPVDPLLGTASPSLPQLPLPLGSLVSTVARTAAPSVVVTEGIPPVSFKMVERIRRWEFVELANLLISQDTKSDEAPFIVDSEQLGYKAPSRAQGKLPMINNIMTWLTAFSRFMAVILTAEATSKEEAAGLAAHQHVILQLHNDLGGNRWLKYDSEYREWAAAKGIRVWGELNLSIYGRCLPQAQPVQGPSSSDVAVKNWGRKEPPVCFQWNKGHCVRPFCSYVHACLECRGPHRKSECPGRVKRVKK